MTFLIYKRETEPYQRDSVCLEMARFKYVNRSNDYIIELIDLSIYLNDIEPNRLIRVKL